jgi:APA family basic amino acid/polyamine antiporter
LKSHHELKRQVGLRTATALVVGEVIAVGIFLTPAGMAKSLGSPLWLLIVWLVMGAMAVCGALCYGELAARYPEAGGGYVYLREAYGRPVAFLYGWMTLLVMDPGLTAALAVGMGTYMGYIFDLSPIAIKTVAVAAIIVLAMINVTGVRLGARLVGWLTVLKLGLLAFILIWGFGFHLGRWSNFAPFVAQRGNSIPLVPALAGGMVAAFFSFGGWWDVAKLAGEVREPARTLPRALIFGVGIVTFVYILTSAVFLYLVPLQSVTSGETFAAQVGEVLFGRAGGEIFAAIVVVTVLGSLAAIIMSAPRVYFAMGRDRLLVQAVASIHPKFGTPARAIALQAVLAVLLAAFGNFNQIISYFIFVVVVFVALTVTSLFVLRARDSHTPNYLTPGYPFTPIVFLLLVTLILFLLGSKQALFGVAVVALGIPVYYFFFRHGHSSHNDKGNISP